MKNQWAKTLGKVFLIIGMILGAPTILPLVLGVVTLKNLEKVEPTEKVQLYMLDLLYVSPISGILYLVYHFTNEDHKKANYAGMKTIGYALNLIARINGAILIFPIIVGIKAHQMIDSEDKNTRIAAVVLSFIFLSTGVGACYLLYFLFGNKKVEKIAPEEKAKEEKAKAIAAQEAQLQHSKIMVEETKVVESGPVAAPKKSGNKRIIVYAAIIGGLAVTALSLFYVSQFEKVKRTEAQSIVTQATSKLKKANKVKASIEAVIPTTEDQTKLAELQHELEVANQHVYYWEQVVSDFEAETFAVGVKFMVACIPAYLFSMGTLVSVGLILKHAEKVKEKEDEAV